MKENGHEGGEVGKKKDEREHHVKLYQENSN